LLSLPASAIATQLSTAAWPQRLAHRGPGLDPRSLPNGFRPRDMLDPTLKDDAIQIKTQDFKGRGGD
jgi:hypothetical protein